VKIASVLYVGPVFVQLFDGRMCCAIGGKSLIAAK